MRPLIVLLALASTMQTVHATATNGTSITMEGTYYVWNINDSYSPLLLVSHKVYTSYLQATVLSKIIALILTVSLSYVYTYSLSLSLMCFNHVITEFLGCSEAESSGAVALGVLFPIFLITLSGAFFFHG